MELKVFLLADHANISNDKLNIIGVFDTITSQQFPFKFPSMHLAIKFVTEQEEIDVEHTIKVQFVDQDEEEIANGEGSFTMPGSATGHRSKATLNFSIAMRDIVFEKPSHYEVRLIVDGELKGTIMLEVVQLENPPKVD